MWSGVAGGVLSGEGRAEESMADEPEESSLLVERFESSSGIGADTKVSDVTRGETVDSSIKVSTCDMGQSIGAVMTTDGIGGRVTGRNWTGIGGTGGAGVGVEEKRSFSRFKDNLRLIDFNGASFAFGVAETTGS